MTSKNQEKSNTTMSPLKAAGGGRILEHDPILHRSCSFLYATARIPKIMVGLKTLLFIMLVWCAPGMAGDADSFPVTAGTGETVRIVAGTTGTLVSGTAITASDGGIITGDGIDVTVTDGGDPVVLSTGSGSLITLTGATITSGYIGAEMRDGGWIDLAENNAIHLTGVEGGLMGVHIVDSSAPSETAQSGLTITINSDGNPRTSNMAWIGVLAQGSEASATFDYLTVEGDGADIGGMAAYGATLTVTNSDITVNGVTPGNGLTIWPITDEDFIDQQAMGLLAFDEATLHVADTNVTVTTSTDASHQGEAYGVYVRQKSTLNMSGGSVYITGDGDDLAGTHNVGIFVHDRSTGMINETEVTTTGIANIGILAGGGDYDSGGIVNEVIATDVKVTTEGADSFAMRVEVKSGSDSESKITLTNGDLKSTGDNSAGITAIGPGSTFTDFGSTITTEGADSIAVWVETGATVYLNGSNVNAEGGGNWGAYLTEESSSLIMSNVTMSTSDWGVVLGGPNATVEMTGGTLTSASDTFVVTDADGILKLDSRAVVQSGNNSLLYVDKNEDEGTIGSVTLTASNGSILVGNMEAEDECIATVSLDTQTVWTGAAINIGDFTMTGDSLWNMTANSDVASLLLDGSAIVFSPPEAVEAFEPKTLTVREDYEGKNGIIALNTYLGDDSSPSDKLIVEGGTSGQTDLIIVNAGGDGALTTGNGIEVVEVSGESAGEFTLVDRVIAGGAYEYHLYQGTTSGEGGNWYLRNTLLLPDGISEVPDIRPEVPLAGAIPLLASDYGFAMVDTMHDRVGELFPPAGTQVCDGGRCGAVWARLLGSRVRNKSGNFLEDGPRYKYTMKGVQVGWDLLARQGADGNDDSAGFYLGYARMSSDVDGAWVGKAGSADLDGYSLGAYWTHRGVEPWYTDLVVQGSLYRAKTKSEYGERIKPRGNGLLASLESGYAFHLTPGLNLEPQAQLAWQTVSIHDAHDNYGTFSYDRANSLRGRLGIRLVKLWEIAEQRFVSAWVRGNVWHEFLGDHDYRVSSRTGGVSDSFTSSLDGTWGEIELGVSGQVTKRVSLFATAGYSRSLDGKGRRSWDGRLGASICW